MSKYYFDENVVGGVLVLGDLGDGVMFSLEPDPVFVEGDIIRNIVFVGLVYLFVFILIQNLF